MPTESRSSAQTKRGSTRTVTFGALCRRGGGAWMTSACIGLSSHFAKNFFSASLSLATRTLTRRVDRKTLPIEKTHKCSLESLLKAANPRSALEIPAAWGWAHSSLAQTDTCHVRVKATARASLRKAHSGCSGAVVGG